MNSRVTRTAVTAIVVIALCVFISTIFKAVASAPKDVERSTHFAQRPVSAKTPITLLIPSIDVEAKVQDVGVAPSGSMAVPTNYTDVGWYRAGPLPGELGSAVIDGHVNNGFGLNAVFADIESLKPGDDTYIETADKTRLHFVVERVATYSRDEVPTDLVFNRADVPRLNLITCSGEFNTDKELYDKRTVVYTVLQS